jgi:hypothetical protein
MSSDVESTRARIRRGGIIGVVGAVVFAALAVHILFGVIGPYTHRLLADPIAVGAIGMAACAVLLGIAAGISLSNSRRYPAVRHLGGPNELARWGAVVVALAVIVSTLPSALSSDVDLGPVLAAVFMAVAPGAIVFQISSANRVVIRASGVVPPAEA